MLLLRHYSPVIPAPLCFRCCPLSFVLQLCSCVRFMNATRSNENLSITDTKVKVKTRQTSFPPCRTSNRPEVCAHVKLLSPSCHSNLAHLKSSSPVSLYFIGRVHVELCWAVPSGSRSQFNRLSLSLLMFLSPRVTEDQWVQQVHLGKRGQG